MNRIVKDTYFQYKLMYLLRFILVFVYHMLVIVYHILVIVYTSFPVQVYVLQGLRKFLCIGVMPLVKVDYEESLGFCNP